MSLPLCKTDHGKDSPAHVPPEGSGPFRTSSSSPSISIAPTTSTDAAAALVPLRLIPPILTNPNILHSRPKPNDLADDDDDVARRLLGPALPHERDAERDAAPEGEAQQQAREPRDGAPHPREDLDGEHERERHGDEEHDVRAAGEQAVEAREERRGDRRGEGDEVPLELLERRGGAEEVRLEEALGRFGEESWREKKREWA